MSEIKVNKITPRAACGTTQLGDSGDTFTIPSGATITNLGTATGFGGTGVVSWDTGSIKTTGFTAVTGTGYFCNTTGGGFTVTLPLSPSAGDVVGVADYAKTFDTDNVTLGRNSSNISGEANDAVLNTEGIAVTLVYVDGTKGWLVTDSGNQSDAPLPTYITATGGCITTCGDYKMHKFTGPNTFVVCSVGNPAGSTTVDYLVVAGGGAGGHNCSGGNSGGGGGAGGMRFSATTYCSPSPLKAPAALPVSATPYAIVVGGGGAGSATGCAKGNNGNNSSFSTITSALGAGAGSMGAPSPTGNGNSGGSGGGGVGTNNGTPGTGGSGNTPSESPPQGKDGGDGASSGGCHQGGGGGGFTACGQDGPAGGDGGDGLALSILGSPVAYGGGGGGGRAAPTGAPALPQGGLGGGGDGSDNPLPGGNPSGSPGTSGGPATGGGGGGAQFSQSGGSGGGGIVIIRYKYQ